MDKPDTLFSKPQLSIPFNFDQNVAEVFPDMIKRSVPGYSMIIQHIEKLAKMFVTDNTQCFDLGCSLGSASLAMSKGIESQNVQITGVDNSLAMLKRCQQHIDVFKHNIAINLQQADILQFPIENASMVVLNFTLQFIPKEQRKVLLNNIYQGMNPGGILVLSEKIEFEDDSINQLMIKLHHDFKKENGYSDLEVSQKRNALENVLIPETLQLHLDRLTTIGFSQANCWFQQFNFMSLIAIK